MRDDMQPTMTEAEIAAWMARVKAPTGPARKYRKPAEWQNMTLAPKRALRRSQKPVSPVTEGACTHRFRIEEANGPESLGTCKKCGETRTYSNTYVADRERPRFGEGVYALADKTQVSRSRDERRWAK